MKEKIINVLIISVPLTLIGVGVWLVYPPAALISVGLLIWIDISKRG